MQCVARPALLERQAARIARADRQNAPRKSSERMRAMAPKPSPTPTPTSDTGDYVATTREPIAAILDALRQARRVLVCGHVRADGDCIGSMAAMHAFLRGQGKACRLYFRGPVLDTFLAFAPEGEVKVTWSTARMSASGWPEMPSKVKLRLPGTCAMFGEGAASVQRSYCDLCQKLLLPASLRSYLLEKL